MLLLTRWGGGQLQCSAAPDALGGGSVYLLQCSAAPHALGGGGVSNNVVLLLTRWGGGSVYLLQCSAAPHALGGGSVTM